LLYASPSGCDSHPCNTLVLQVLQNPLRLFVPFFSFLMSSHLGYAREKLHGIAPITVNFIFMVYKPPGRPLIPVSSSPCFSFPNRSVSSAINAAMPRPISPLPFCFLPFFARSEMFSFLLHISLLLRSLPLALSFPLFSIPFFFSKRYLTPFPQITF